ncbi:hypothetical protein DV735_g5566, partial [Chaetothyriales sp. CBS 134920]
MATRHVGSDLFDFTEGRFLFNEKQRLAERHVEFNVDALAEAVCNSTSRPLSDLTAITKLAEGGFNRMIQVSFSDGYAVLARIPYQKTSPKNLVIASEAATLSLLRSHGLPVPKVLGYSTTCHNPVGTEYVFLEKVEGRPLGGQWFSMNNKARFKIMSQIVDLETKYMAIPFAANGSLYHQRDLDRDALAVPIDRRDLDRDALAVPIDQSSSPDDGDCLVLGPTVKYEWWFQERASLDVDRGPWCSFRQCFEAPARREISYCRTYGKPRLHFNRYLRELHGLQLHSPTDHIKLLNDYLKVSPYIELPGDHVLARPVLRHPDLSPNNIIVNEDNDIVSIIDWQHAVILPLCLAASIPQHFQNWGDPISEKLTQPEVKLPPDFEQKDEGEQEQIKETMRKRLVHFLYAALTMKQNPSHFSCISETSLMTRAKLFSEASAPWEGDSVTLKNALFAVCQNWPLDKYKNGEVIVPGHGIPVPSEPPLYYTTEEVDQATSLYAQEQEKLTELAEMKEYIGIDSVGWVPDEASLERAIQVRDTIKSELLKNCESELEIEATEHHFPFQDFEDGDD